jgi:hypothetical protein
MAANDHQLRAALPLVISIADVRWNLGRQKRNPATVVAKEAFDCGLLLASRRWFGIEPHSLRRGSRTTRAERLPLVRQARTQLVRPARLLPEARWEERPPSPLILCRREAPEC